MKLYFKNSKDEYRFVVEVDDVDSGIKMALEDLKTNYPHFKSYYQRVWQEDDGTWWVDVGDYVCYYIIKGGIDG